MLFFRGVKTFKNILKLFYLYLNWFRRQQVVDKLAAYICVRFLINVFPESKKHWVVAWFILSAAKGSVCNNTRIDLIEYAVLNVAAGLLFWTVGRDAHLCPFPVILIHHLLRVQWFIEAFYTQKIRLLNSTRYTHTSFSGQDSHFCK